MKILFLGKTETSLKELLTIIKHQLGKSLKIDELRISPPLALLATLSDLKDVPCDFTNLGSLLRHEHYTYLVIGTEREMTDLAWESGLNITTDPSCEIAVVSGNLQQWRSAFLDGCSDSSLYSFREFTNLIFVDMCNRGIGQLFANYRKVPLKDNTFKLLPK